MRLTPQPNSFAAYPTASAPTKPVISLNFDDGYASDATIALPRLRALGFRGTSYVTTSAIGTPGFLSWPQIAALANAGWSIGNHSHTHVYLTSLSLTGMASQFDTSTRLLRAHGHVSGSIYHANPYGDTNQTVQNVGRSRFAVMRGGGSGPFTWPPTNNLAVPYTSVRSDNYLSVYKSLIDDTITNGQVLNLTFHRIVETPATAFETSIGSFEELLLYLHAASQAGDVDVLTVEELWTGRTGGPPDMDVWVDAPVRLLTQH